MIIDNHNRMAVPIMSACRDGEELDSQGDASSQPDTISIASRTSQNTLDSDKVGKRAHTHTLFPGILHPQNMTENMSFTCHTLQFTQSVCSLSVIGPYHAITQ